MLKEEGRGRRLGLRIGEDLIAQNPRLAEDFQLYHDQRAEPLLQAIFDKADPEIWGDIRAVVPLMRKAYQRRLTSPYDSTWGTINSRKSVLNAADLYNRILDAPWNTDNLPGYYKVNTPLTTDDYSYNTLGYVRPFRLQEFLGTYDPEVLLHEKTHTMQNQPGNPIRNTMLEVQRSLGRNKGRLAEHELTTPYGDRYLEKQADEMPQKLWQFLGLKKDYGLEPGDPFLKMFMPESDEPRGPAIWDLIVR